MIEQDILSLKRFAFWGYVVAKGASSLYVGRVLDYDMAWLSLVPIVGEVAFLSFMGRDSVFLPLVIGCGALGIIAVLTDALHKAIDSDAHQKRAAALSDSKALAASQKQVRELLDRFRSIQEVFDTLESSSGTTQRNAQDTQPRLVDPHQEGSSEQVVFPPQGRVLTSQPRIPHTFKAK